MYGGKAEGRQGPLVKGGSYRAGSDVPNYSVFHISVLKKHFVCWSGSLSTFSKPV